MTVGEVRRLNTRNSSDWQPTVFLGGDIAEKVREIKQQDRPDSYDS